MFTAGFLVFLSTFLPERTAAIVACMLPITVFVVWLFMTMTHEIEDDLPAILPEFPLWNISPFFRRRFDFLQRGHDLTGESIYQFKLLKNTVIAVSGGPARHDFFTSRQLDLGAGFRALSGTIPMLPGVTSDPEPSKVATIYRRLATVQNSTNLERLIPKLLEDIRQSVESWGTSGMLSPFDELPKITFQTNLRCLAPVELADHGAVAARLRELYQTLDASTTPAGVLCPWLPSPSIIRKILCTMKIHDVISQSVDARLRGHVLPQDDALQLMIDNGDDRAVIVGFIMGLLVAGARSTGATVSWLTTFLAGNPSWKGKAVAEIQHLLSSCNALEASHSAVVAGALSAVPLTAWESETPVLDAIIRETLRVAQPHTALRQNTSPFSVHIAGKTVPPGAFAVYPFADVHLSAELYPDPWRFDPGRLPSKMPFAWVGWGAGASVCLGQRLARLELKLVAAVLLLTFELELVDTRGRVLQGADVPRPDWNDALHCRPTEPCTLRYRSRGWESGGGGGNVSSRCQGM